MSSSDWMKPHKSGPVRMCGKDICLLGFLLIAIICLASLPSTHGAAVSPTLSHISLCRVVEEININCLYSV